MFLLELAVAVTTKLPDFTTSSEGSSYSALHAAGQLSKLS
jgi:hypothetical protein